MGDSARRRRQGPISTRRANDLESARRKVCENKVRILNIEEMQKSHEEELSAIKNELAAKNLELTAKYHELAAMKRESEVANSNNQYQCVICCSGYGEELVVALPCGHVYHQHCLKNWFREVRVCPMCNKYTPSHPLLLYLTGGSSNGTPETHFYPSEERNGSADSGEPISLVDIVANNFRVEGAGLIITIKKWLQQENKKNRALLDIRSVCLVLFLFSLWTSFAFFGVYFVKLIVLLVLTRKTMLGKWIWQNCVKDKEVFFTKFLCLVLFLNICGSKAMLPILAIIILMLFYNMHNILCL